MHELHPGVRDMAVDTFLKISQKCKRKFVVLQAQERAPFIEEILQNLPSTISDLESHQVQTYYEGVGHMVSAQTDPSQCQLLMQGKKGTKKMIFFVIIAFSNKTQTVIKSEGAASRMEHCS